MNLGVDSYRQGKAYFFDKETGKVSEADDLLGQEVGEGQPRARQAPARSWAGRPTPWKARPSPRPGYQKLEGDWVDGQDPARKA